MTKKYELMDLEQAIQTVWQTKDDLDLITSCMMDGPKPMTEDEISNVMIGLSELHEIRCNKLFNIYEGIIHERQEKITTRRSD